MSTHSSPDGLRQRTAPTEAGAVRCAYRVRPGSEPTPARVIVFAKAPYIWRGGLHHGGVRGLCGLMLAMLLVGCGSDPSPARSERDAACGHLLEQGTLERAVDLMKKPRVETKDARKARRLASELEAIQRSGRPLIASWDAPAGKPVVP